MENREFISAADLPEATSDKVSVLCVENGQMKRKAGVSFGDEVCDMKIRFNTTTGSCELVQGFYNQVVSKINNDVFPTIYIITEGSGYKKISISSIQFDYNQDRIYIRSDDYRFFVHSDNSVEFVE